MRLASLVLTVPVVFYSAGPFFRGAWRDFQRRRLGMDVPIALGIGVAFGASLYATFAGGARSTTTRSRCSYSSCCARATSRCARGRRPPRASSTWTKRCRWRRTVCSTTRRHGNRGGAGRFAAQRRPGAGAARRSFLPTASWSQGDTEMRRVAADGREPPGAQARRACEVIAGALNRLSPVVMRVKRVGEERACRAFAG